MNNASHRGDLHDPDGPHRGGPDERDGSDRDEHTVRYRRPQRPAPELVERVRRQAHAEEEPEQAQSEPVQVQLRRGRRPERDVGEVPDGVGRVQEGPPVAPTSRCERVERRPVLGHDDFTPQSTTADPNRNDLVRTWRIPAAWNQRTHPSIG